LHHQEQGANQFGKKLAHFQSIASIIFVSIITSIMSLLNNNAKKGDKKDKKNTASAAANAKFGAKPGKAVSFSKKPMKTGGTRGS